MRHWVSCMSASRQIQTGLECAIAPPAKPMPPQAPQVELLSRLPAADREELQQLGVIKQYSKGDFVFQAGKEAKSVFLLHQGRIKIYQPSSVGKEAILWFCFGGELFGLAESARGAHRAVSAQACESSEVLCIAQDRFMAFLATHPKTAQIVVQLLAGRLRVLSEVVINLISDDVRTRIRKMLLQFGTRGGRRNDASLELAIPLTHQEIADMVGTTRQTVTSVLSELQKQGLIRLESRRIHIENLELLKEMANPG